MFSKYLNKDGGSKNEELEITKVLSIVVVSLIFIAMCFLWNTIHRQKPRQLIDDRQFASSTTTANSTSRRNRISLFINMNGIGLINGVELFLMPSQKTGVKFNLRVLRMKAARFDDCIGRSFPMCLTDVELNRLSDEKYCYDYR